MDSGRINRTGQKDNPTADTTAPGSSSAPAEKPRGYTGADSLDLIRLAAQSPSAIADAAHFEAKLGRPRTRADYEVAVDRAVAAVAGRTASTQPNYARFNGLLQRMPPDVQQTFYERAYRATRQDALPTSPAKLGVVSFFSHLFAIQSRSGVVVPPSAKSAHEHGVSGVVKVEVKGDVPPWLTATAARLRLAPALSGKAPGMGISFFGPQGEASRVLMCAGKGYDQTLRTRFLGLSSKGPEGELEFIGSPELASVRFAEGGNAWMSRVAALPAGTWLGTLRPEGAANWSIEVEVGDTPLSHNLFGELSSRFTRKLSFTGVGSALAWTGAALLASPLLLASAVVGLARRAAQ